MSRPTAYRFLVTLSQRGYVTGAEDGCYRLGNRVLSLGSSLLNSLDLLQLSNPDLHELSQVTHETAHLALLNGSEILKLDHLIFRRSAVNRQPSCLYEGGFLWKYVTPLISSDLNG